MSSIGKIQVHAYASNAELPLRDVAIVITTPDKTALAMQLTDSSGLTRAVEIPVPDKIDSQEPGIDETPYTLVNIYAKRQNYKPVIAENIQVFPGTTTYQDLEMEPLSQQLSPSDETIHYITPPQNL